MQVLQLGQAPAIMHSFTCNILHISDPAHHAAANGCGHGGRHLLRVPAGRHAGQHAHVARAAQGLHPGHLLPRQRPALCAAPGRQLLRLHGQPAAGRRAAHAGAPPAVLHACSSLQASYVQGCGAHFGLWDTRYCRHAFKELDTGPLLLHYDAVPLYGLVRMHCAVLI